MTSSLDTPLSRLNASRPIPSRTASSYADYLGGSNHIRLERGVGIDLGSVNGKPLVVTNYAEGGFAWTGSPAVQGTPIGKVLQADMDVVRLASSFTRTESEYAYKIATVVNGLYRLTQRTRRPLSIQEFNNVLKERSIDSSVVADALGRLGIDINRTFSVNGRKMYVSDGRFVDAE